MKIAIINTDFRAPYWPPRLRAVGRAARDRNDELSLVEIAGKGSLYAFEKEKRDLAGIPVHRLFADEDLRTLSPRTASRALFAKLDELAPDVAAATAIAFVSGATAVRWARRRRRGAVIMDNARAADVPRSTLVNAVKRRVYRNVDAVLVPAPSHRESYAGWGLPPDRIFFGLNVVDNAWFARGADAVRAEAARHRRERGLPERFFLGVGRHVPKKNWGTVIAAHRDYAARCGSKPWELVLVGNGPERERLERMAASSRAGRVRFMEFLSQEEVCACYALAEALVLPSTYGETWGNVVNEAMACALPVVVSNQCGCSSTLVREGENGWTFDPADRGRLAEIMRLLAQSSDAQRASMGAASRRVIADWPLERFVDGILAAVRTAGERPRSAPSPLDRMVLALWNGRYRPT